MTKNSPRAQQFVADDQRADGVVAGASTGVADDVGIAFGQPGKFRGIESGVHASENGEAPAGRQCQFAFFAEIGGIFCIRFQNFRKNFAHRVLLACLTWPCATFVTSPEKQKAHEVNRGL